MLNKRMMGGVLVAFVVLAGSASHMAAADVGSLADANIVAWGHNEYGQCNVPAGYDYTQIAGGGLHSLAIRSDGSLIAWGGNQNGQCNVPAGNTYTRVAAGNDHSLALRSDGSLAAWGWNNNGECNVPTSNSYTQTSGGLWYSLAVLSNGSLAAWGWSGYGQCNVPAGNNFIQVAGGGFHGLALRGDGSLVAWGDNGSGQYNVPAGNNYTQISAGWIDSMALRSDGSLVAWGYNGDGRCNVPPGNNYIQVAAGANHGVALRSDGSLAAWGDNTHGQCNSPTSGYYLAVAAGYHHCLALKARDVYDADLLVTDSGSESLFQRSITVAGNATINTTMTMQNNPTMTVAGQTQLTGTGRIVGAGTIAGDVRALYGSSIEAAGNLTLGDSSSFTGFIGEGDVTVGSHAVTIYSKTTAKLGRTVSIAGGELTVPKGFLVDGYSMLVGTGTVNGRVVNQGLVAAGDPGDDLTFNGLVSGAGSFTGSIVFNGGFSPGNSPAITHLDWGTFGPGNVLTMEIGGLAAGSQYDQLIANNSLTADGMMDVLLIDSFAPKAGDSFDLFDGTITGKFDAVNLPSLAGGLSWDTSRLYTEGAITVVPEPSTVALVGIGLFGLLGYAWQRRKRAAFFR